MSYVMLLHINKGTLEGKIHSTIDFDPVPFCTMIL